MTATTHSRTTRFAGVAPGRGTFPMAANMLILAGTIVCRDAGGRAVSGIDDNNAFPAMGKASSNFDNRTTAPEGGGAGAINCEVEYGVFGWAFTGTTPVGGQVVYVVDNQTVSLDSDSGTRGIAGYVTYTEGTTCYVLMGPTVAGQIVIAASEASQLDTAQADIDALQADALSAQSFIPIPITSWLDGGAPLAAFVDGSVNGVALVDSKAVGFRFNPVGQDTSTLSTSIAMPPDLDDAASVVLHVLAFRIGSSDTTTVLVGNAFFQEVGAAHTADTDAITVDSAALNAATTVVGEYTLTVAGADVPPAPCALTLTLAPSSALDADDLVIVGTWLEYTRKLLTS